MNDVGTDVDTDAESDEETDTEEEEEEEEAGLGPGGLLEQSLEVHHGDRGAYRSLLGRA